MLEFEGKVAVITGAAKGMGFGCAKKFLTMGATVVLVDRDEEGLANASALLVGANSTFAPRITSKVIDVSLNDSVKAGITEVENALGRIDYLINCAGIQTYGTVLETDEELWDKTLNVNVKSMFLMAKYAIPVMQRNRSGSIVNISSVQSLANQKGVVAYATSKGAINSLTRALAIDNAEFGIRVNAVLPGSIDTPMLRAAAESFRGEKPLEEVLGDWGSSHPIGRIGTIDEVAELVAFLASERASFITGSSYVIDGGLMVQVPVVLPK